jgi:type I restriction enzyme S subunit
MSDTRLGELCTLNYGKALRNYEPDPDESLPVRVFGTNGPIGWASLPLYDRPTIVIGRKGAYRGVHFAAGPSWTIDTAYYLTLRTDDIDLKWLYYRLLIVDINRMDTGSAIPSTKREDFYSVSLRVPSLGSQQHIASILSAYDDLIENNRRRIQLLEQAARLLYKEWFVHLRFPGHEHVKIKNGVPGGWEKKCLENVAEITMGQSPKSEYYNEDGVGLPFHQGVTNFGIRFPTNKMSCTVENRIAEPGDILFSVRAPVGRINITLDRMVIGRGLAAIRSNSRQQNFLYYQLKNHFFKEDMMGGGAIFAAITKKDLHGVELMTPQRQLVEIFQEQVVPIDRQIEISHRAIEQLTQARDLLLPRLMNGDIAA